MGPRRGISHFRSFFWWKVYVQRRSGNPDTPIWLNLISTKASIFNGLVLVVTVYPKATPPDILFVGSKGTIAIKGSGYIVYDSKGKETKKATGDGGESEHLANFISAVRGNGKLNSPYSRRA